MFDVLFEYANDPAHKQHKLVTYSLPNRCIIPHRAGADGKLAANDKESLLRGWMTFARRRTADLLDSSPCSYVGQARVEHRPATPKTIDEWCSLANIDLDSRERVEEVFSREPCKCCVLLCKF